MFSIKSSLKLGLLGVACFAVSACGTDFNHPTYASQEQIRVQQDQFYHERKPAEITQAFLDDLARHYDKYGGDGLNLSVTYDPQIPGASTRATNELTRISQALLVFGVDDVQGNVFPVQSQRHEKVIVSYNVYNALAPEGCDETMDLFDKSHAEYDREFKLGCASETFMAKQIYRARDLKGTDWTARTYEGRAASNQVDVYRSGIQNPPLGGESASGSN